jgi:hypothetical protein
VQAAHLVAQRVGQQRHGLRIVVAEVDEPLASDVDVVVVAQEVLHHGLAVHQRAVGAAEVLEERVGEDRDDRGVLA